MSLENILTSIEKDVANSGAKFEDICEARLEELANKDPDALLALISSRKLRPTILTYAAEQAGLIKDTLAVTLALVPLLDYPEAYVREGALYGLSSHLTFGVRYRLELLVITDPSIIIRDIAQQILKDK